MLDLHIHDLDTLNWLFGKPRTLFARGQRGAHGGWDAALTVLDYNGVACFAEGNALMPASYPFTMALRVLCEGGVVEYSLRAGGEQVDSAAGGGNSLVVYKNGEAPRQLEHPGGDGYENEIAAFVDCVRTGQAPTQGTAEQGRLAVSDCAGRPRVHRDRQRNSALILARSGAVLTELAPADAHGSGWCHRCRREQWRFRMKKFDHMGLPTDDPQPNEMWVEETRVWVTDPTGPSLPRRSSCVMSPIRR